MSRDFFEKLPVLNKFEEITNLESFQELPDDWFVFISDVIDSRKAIKEGKYKEVNTIGASCIVAVINSLEQAVLPYVFGGDGASICIHPDQYDQAMRAFQGTKKMAKSTFDLELRIGAIPVKDIRKKGRRILMAKLQVSKAYTQAIFFGGGLALADKMLKSDSGYQFPESPTNIEADFSGLECRWNKITKENRSMVSLLIKVNNKDQSEAMIEYQKIIGQLNSIVSSEHPITEKALNFSFNPTWLKNEFRARNFFKSLRDKILYVIDLYYRIIIGKILMYFSIETNGFNWGNYKPELIANSDYKKFDDLLRLVVACTKQEKNQLIQFLDNKEEDGTICYGAHFSESALVTCVIQEYSGMHFHFVDGDEGGYTMAAIDLAGKLK